MVGRTPYYGTRISKHVSSPNVVIPPELTLLGYDLGGRLVQADNRFAEISRGYYPNGALKGDTTRYRSHDLTYDAGFALTTALTYTYDLSGRRLSRVDNMGGRQLYGYNAVGQLESTTDSLNAGAKVAFTFAYDSLGRLVTQASPTASTTATWTYDVEGRPLTRSEEGFSDVLRYDARGKRIGVQGQLLLSGGYAGVSLMAYDGLGQLSASTNSDRERRTTDAVALDAFGNVKARHANKLVDAWNDGEQLDSTSYDGSRMTGRFGKFFPSKTFPTKFADSIMVEYDNAGNVRHQQLIRREWVTAGNERRANNGHSWTWNFYDADNRLRFAQVTRYAPTNIKETTFEDYWYDALGRRIAVRTRADSIKCYPAEPTYECIQPHTRTVWDGDQVLVEYRNNGDWSLIDASVGGGSYHPSLAEHYGKVRYMSTGAIDAPLAVWKNDAAPRVLHRNWRGSVAGATYVDGDSLDTGTVWPAAYTDIFFRSDANQTIPQPNRWLGSLVLDQRDATGNLYRRNRYYDPVTGRFTQEDPIGLAGGMNLYGYAAGDPVNLSDPLGLCPESAGGDGKTEDLDDCPRGSSGWWALRDARGEGSKVVNNVMIVWASFNFDMQARMPENMIYGTFDLPIGSVRSAARLTSTQAADLAKWLGYTKKVKDAPFNAMGQAVFSNGETFISLDLTMHLGPIATWKMFSKRGARIGTFTYDLGVKLGN